MTAALELFGEHLRQLPDVNMVVVDEGIDYTPVDLPFITVEEYKITKAKRFTGTNAFISLQWLVTIYAPDKATCRLLAARIRHMYRKANQQSGDRYNAMNALRIVSIDWMDGELAKYNKVNNDPKLYSCTLIMEAIYDELEEGLY